ncbi:hypothetical protein C6496_02880 [Candidatus Poribacteria bacterium]|nr:MAG: hypothetical protein C6496_02880 [Candidatus Poribacteria bacterium]
MLNINKKLSGCYRRVLIFLLAVVGICLIAGIIVYRQIGGVDGTRYWMAERALNGVEKHLKKSENRPDGISEQQIITVFTNVREANRNRRTNLTALYDVLKSYQTEFYTKKPSTPEVETFLGRLRQTILKDTVKE